MFGTTSKSGITRRFRDIGSDLPVETDDAGFIVPSLYSLTIDQALAKLAILVRGQPWTGKTYVANEIFKQHSALKLGDHVWFQPLDKHTVGRPLKPRDWDDWLSNREKRACWIIDSVDEGELIQANVYTEITGLLQEAGKQACQRLKLIMFVRETDVPRELSEFLENHFRDSFSNLELLPLDRENAERIVGRRLEHTLAAIENFSLQSVARYPAALEYISRHSSDSSLSEVEVWRGILAELLRERSGGVARKDVPRQELEHLFRAAAHLAVVMTFAEVPRVSISAVGPVGPDVADLISADPEPKGPTRAAARDAIKTTMFHNGRFSQKNIREWMCAFGLATIGLTRLKPLITDPAGELERKHFGLLSLLHKTTHFTGEVGHWLIEKNGGVPPRSDVTLSLDESLSIINRLESIADTTQWNINLWGERGLSHLDTPGIGPELATRIADRSRSANRRELLLQIAIQTNARHVLPTAIGVVQDCTAAEEVRQTALGCVFQIGTRADLIQLEAFARGFLPSRRVEKAMVSALIRYYLDEKMWSVEECARHAPQPENDVIDSTHVLAHKLQEAMTVEAARIIVDRQLPEILGRRPRKKGTRSRAERRDDDLFRAALDALLSQDPPNDDDLDRLLPLALHDKYDLYAVIRGVSFYAAYGRSAKARRRLFVAEIRRNARRKPGKGTRNYIWILSPDDVEWLMEHVVELSTKEEQVWAELLRIARGAASPLKRRARDMVRMHRPDIVDHTDKAFRSHRQRERRRRDRREREELKRQDKYTHITDAVRELLSNSSRSLRHKMWRLSWVCFGGDQERPHDVVGTWDDLERTLQDAVLDVCQEALQACDPTAIPEGSTFPSTILYEAWCFRDVALRRPNGLKLTSELIVKWLPSMFIVDMDGGEEVTAACYRASREATESVFLDAIKRELRSESEHMIRAASLDEVYWSSSVATSVATLIVDAQYSERPRAELLRIFAERAPECADSLLRETLKSSRSVMWLAALGSLLRIDVAAAWPYVQLDYEERGKGALLDLRALYHDRRDRISIDSPEWTAERLLDLARMLYGTFPPDEDSESSAWVTPEQEISEIRASIPQILFRRNAPGDRQALDQLVSDQRHLRNWYDRAKAQEEARGELARATLLAPEHSSVAGPPPYHKIVKLLENAAYRIVRNEDDLLNVVEEELRRIGSEAGRHIEMLYLPDEISGGTKRRHESALQSYIECRLADRLPARILDAATSVSVHRERQAQFRERTDIQVDAPLLHSGLGSVVIEVKWSDNNERRRNISIALMKQLGDRYLLADGKTHGIYFIGWNGRLGKWRSGAGERPASSVSSQTLEVALQRQARKYMDEHKGIRIRPIVIDLTWPKS